MRGNLQYLKIPCPNDYVKCGYNKKREQHLGVLDEIEEKSIEKIPSHVFMTSNF